MTQPVVFLMGPTASGKTDLAMAIHDRLPVDIISVDSAMIYRGMDIGTAKPTREELARVPHRLVDILDPSEAYSAAQFRNDALREIRAIHSMGRIPLLVGGTMLYFRALQSGLADLPSADAATRARIEEEAAREGWDAMHRRLAAIDPASAARIHPNDPQRLQRALEVYALTGVPLSEHLARSAGTAFPYRAVEVVVAPSSHGELRARIRHRFEHMLERGFLDEVETLRARGDLGPDLPSIRCVGYRQAWSFLDGAIDRDMLVETAVTATLQLAKRQLTWLRQWTSAARFDALDSQTPVRVLNFLSGVAIE